MLARVEAIDRVDRLGLTVYAHLQDANGRAYVLVVASKGELEQAGWPFTVLALEPDIGALSMAIERMPGARERARKQIDVLYDDGRRFILTPTPELAAKLIGLGMAIIRINTPMAWPDDLEGRAAWLKSRAAVHANATISNLMSQVSRDAISNLTAMLDGEKEAAIGGESYTILTRYTASGEPIQKANQFVYEQLRAAGLEVAYQGWASNSLSGSNIVGVKRGSTLPNEVVLVTAHIDSLPDGDPRAPGADDNASGCVGVMTAANVFSNVPTDRTIRFICFGGEEQGLLGSDAYAASIKAAGETNATVFNMDMIAYSTIPSREMLLHTRLSTDPDYAEDVAVATTFRDVLSVYGMAGRLTAVITNSGETASDHYSFWHKGYPGVLAIESDNDFNTNYHKSSDLTASMNMEYFTDFVRAAVGTVGHLAGVPAVPAKTTGVNVSNGTFKDKIRVSWSPAAYATGYMIWRNTTNDSTTAQLVGTTGSTNIDDTSVEANHFYYYWVQATNSYGAGDISDPDDGYELSGPGIWANRLDDAVEIYRGNNLTISVAVNPDDFADLDVDWWVVAFTGTSWYCMNNSLQWIECGGTLLNCQPVYQGALFNLPDTDVLSISTLPTGSYVFWFAVDYPMDGILNPNGQILYDKVIVMVR